MAQVERLYLKVMLPVSLLMLAAISAFNIALERRIQAKLVNDSWCNGAADEVNKTRLELDLELSSEEKDVKCIDNSTSESEEKSKEVEDKSSGEVDEEAIAQDEAGDTEKKDALGLGSNQPNYPSYTDGSESSLEVDTSGEGEEGSGRELSLERNEDALAFSTSQPSHLSYS